MKHLIAIVCGLLISACGGGGEDSRLITTVNGPIKSQSLVTSTAASTAVLHLYQAIDGIAPNNAALKTATEQIGDGNGFAWANAASPDASRISDSDLAIRVLNNIGITNTSLTATASFGTSQQAYDALRKALADYFFATGPANRGTVILQLTQIISKFEGETTFGVYGNAATSFNRQVALNAAYSSNPSNIVNAIVPTAIANPGMDQKAVVGIAVKLDGSASKVDFGKNLTYFWTLKTKPAGSSAALTSAVVVNPSFTPDMAGTYIASLIVNDGRASSSAATVTIVATAPNSAPVANIVAPSSYSIGGTLVLSAAGSQDRDGDALTYLWSFTAPAANSALLYGHTTATASITPTIPGTYTFSLIVNDGKLISNVVTVSVVVTASATANIAPVAVASAPASSVQGNVLALNANGSSDANGDPLTYSWHIFSSPVGSSAVLNNPTSAKPTITPTVAGLYGFLLTVSDGKLIGNASVIVSVAETVIPETPSSCYSSLIMSPTPFFGNDGEIFKLNDGTYWEVAGLSRYLYAYYPSITICPKTGELTINGKTINVRRLQGVIESTTDESEGWDGVSLIPLNNGQVWLQTDYYYAYKYAYNATVFVYQSETGFLMQIQGIEKSVGVIQLQGVIKSNVDGQSEGWNGTSRITLTNGQIWLQKEFYYNYRYSYRPAVWIYQNGGRYFMKIDGIQKSVEVTRVN